MNEFQDVVLTGLGAITALGDFTLHGEKPSPAKIAASGESGSIKNFALENYLASQKTYLDRCSALALAGCALALKDAQIEAPANIPADAHRFGITLGTHFGCIETMKNFWDKAIEKGVRLANPLLFSHSYFNSPISLCAIEFGLKGYHATFCANENSGAEAVRAAFDAIRLGHADAMVCGGVDAVTPTRALCAPSERAGEASVFFVLENKKHALDRGAKTPSAISESWFDSLEFAEKNAAHFGDYGGAGSTLALAISTLDFTQP